MRIIEQIYRSIIVGGGWVWKFVFFLIVLAPIYYPKIQSYFAPKPPEETGLMLPDISKLWFYLAAAILAAVMLAWRLVALETKQVRLVILAPKQDENGQHLRLRVENLSSKELDGISCRLESIIDKNGAEITQLDFPLVLQTSQAIKERQARASRGLPADFQRRRFRISAGDHKDLELFNIDNTAKLIRIPHELGDTTIICSEYTFTIRVVGAGPPSELELQTTRTSDKTLVYKQDNNGTR